MNLMYSFLAENFRQAARRISLIGLILLTPPISVYLSKSAIPTGVVSDSRESFQLWIPGSVHALKKCSAIRGHY